MIAEIGLGLSIGQSVVGLGTTFANSIEAKKQATIQGESQRDQALSNKATTDLNYSLVQNQLNMFNTGVDEQKLDIEREGQSLVADNQALMAASGFGAAGTSRAQIRQIRGRTTEGLGRLEINRIASTEAYNLHLSQLSEQSIQHGIQAGYAQDLVDLNKLSETEENVDDFLDTMGKVTDFSIDNIEGLLIGFAEGGVPGAIIGAWLQEYDGDLPELSKDALNNIVSAGGEVWDNTVEFFDWGWF